MDDHPGETPLLRQRHVAFGALYWIKWKYSVRDSTG